MSKFGLIFGTRSETKMLVIDNFQLGRMATVRQMAVPMEIVHRMKTWAIVTAVAKVNIWSEFYWQKCHR